MNANDNKKIHDAINKVLCQQNNNSSISRVLNDITIESKVSLDFKETTEIARLIEPQIRNRNILKLLIMKGQETE